MPKISKSRVTQAGKQLVTAKTIQERGVALDTINKWRALHLRPLTHMRNLLSNQLKRNNIEPYLLSQRIKRIASIEYKLDLNRNMALGGMQDIGGYRAVLNDLRDLDRVKRIIENNKATRRYTLIRTDDYLNIPRETGYRSIHFVYKYHSDNQDVDGLFLELQIRTKLQHNWATAVETAGMYTRTSLKSGKGPDNWLQFFRITSSLFAIKEKTNVIVGHKEIGRNSLMKECHELTQELNAVSILRALRVSANSIHESKLDWEYYLLKINFAKQIVQIKPFKKSDDARATFEYLEEEKQVKDGEAAVVLVSAKSIKTLKKAYPSYFLDTSEFIQAIEKISANCKKLGLIK